MSVISINGLPGKGKTLTSVNLAIKHYKDENKFLTRIIRKLQRKSPYINNVYSNFPILLDKKRNVYSRKVDIDDLRNNYKFLPNALIIIDEIQLFYDSDEYKTFPRIIANFNQAHRHFGIKDIIYISQHPSRVVKKLRNVVSVYYRIKKCLCIPILKIGFISCRISYEFEDYEVSFTKDKELKKLKDIKTKVFFCNFRKIYKRYDTVYLKPLNIDKPLLDFGSYSSLDLEDREIERLESKLF